MTIFDHVTLFPNVRFNAGLADDFGSLFGKVAMLALDEDLTGLPNFVEPLTFAPNFLAEVKQTYLALKNFGDQVLADNSAAAAYANATQGDTPFYDREMTYKLLSDFKRQEQALSPAEARQREQQRASALTLLLGEDLETLSREAQSALKAAAPRADHMWRDLKGAPDPLQPDEMMDPEFGLIDDNFAKKRLTAWSILARMQKLGETAAFVTWDELSFNQCLALFPAAETFREASLKTAEAGFYKIPGIGIPDFLNVLQGKSLSGAGDSEEFVVIGLIKQY